MYVRLDETGRVVGERPQGLQTCWTRSGAEHWCERFNQARILSGSPSRHLFRYEIRNRSTGWW